MAVAIVGAPAAHGQISLAIPANIPAHPGDTIQVLLNFSVNDSTLDTPNGNGIASVGFDIAYNAVLGTVAGSSIALGSVISNPNYGFTPYSGNSNNSAGHIRTFSLSNPGTPGLPAGTNGSVAVMNFTVPAGTTPGSYPLTLTPDSHTFITQNFNAVTYTSGNGLSLTNGSILVTAVPEPTSLALVGLFALPWALWRRRRPLRLT
jgi:hypothetical protein